MKKELLKSLSAFQNECPILYKEAEAGQGNFKYNYVDLPSIIKVINPLLAKYSLMFTQSHIQGIDGQIGVVTRVYHTDTGDFIESTIMSDVIEMRGMNLYQSLGSLSTYLRRYDLSSILGLVTEKDNDASGEQTAPARRRVVADKPKLESGTEKFEQAVAFLKNGNSITAIQSKYDITQPVLMELQQAAK